MTTASWVQRAEINGITGGTVIISDDADVLAAQSVVDLYTNTTYSTSANYGTVDLYWLKQAVAWQAVWMVQQPGFNGRSSVLSVSQDGGSTTFSSKTAVNLSPLAARAIRNLSWKKAKHLTSRIPGTGVYWRDSLVNDALDDVDVRWQQI